MCREFPGYRLRDFGFDDLDPRLMRAARLLLNIYDTAQARARADDKSKWDKFNPGSKRLLSWARTGESDAPDPSEVRVSVPERPANWRDPTKVE